MPLEAPPSSFLAASALLATIGIATQGPEIAILPAAALADQSGHAALWVLDPSSGTAHLQPVELAGFAGDGTVLVSGGIAKGNAAVKG